MIICLWAAELSDCDDDSEIVGRFQLLPKDALEFTNEILLEYHSVRSAALHAFLAGSCVGGIFGPAEVPDIPSFLAAYLSVWTERTKKSLTTRVNLSTRCDVEIIMYCRRGRA